MSAGHFLGYPAASFPSPQLQRLLLPRLSLKNFARPSAKPPSYLASGGPPKCQDSTPSFLARSAPVVSALEPRFRKSPCTPTFPKIQEGNALGQAALGTTLRSDAGRQARAGRKRPDTDQILG